MRLCVCVGPRPESRRGRVGSHTAIRRPDGSIWLSPNRRTPRGLSSWDLLWVEEGVLSEHQLRTFLEEDQPPNEVLVCGPCGALQPGIQPGFGMYANEVLDPERGPHWPRPPRALAFPAVQKALQGGAATGKLLTTQVPCATPNHKLESGHGYGAIAVDRDSGLLCRPCQELELGHAVLRFVLDPAEVDLSLDTPEADEAAFRGALACERSLFRVLTSL